jgi:hypothetical protein
LAGCGSTPTARWASAAESLNIARDTTLELHAAGVVSDATLIKADKVEKVARGALKVAEAQLPEGGEGFEHWLSVAKGGIIELAAAYAEEVQK